MAALVNFKRLLELLLDYAAVEQALLGGGGGVAARQWLRGHPFASFGGSLE